jgi:hypothetical protein
LQGNTARLVEKQRIQIPSFGQNSKSSGKEYAPDIKENHGPFMSFYITSFDGKPSPWHSP